jgi:single-strand DNA-binding protein
MLNRVILIGRLTKDPEFRTTTTGKNFATFGLAVQKRFKPQDPNERDADFFNIKVWGQTAEYAKNYLTKGQRVACEGRIEMRKYTDQQGVQKDFTEIICDNLSGLDKARDDSGSPAQAQSGGAPRSVAPAEEEYDPFAE